MARPTITDYLQNYSFWLMDVGPLNAHSLPVLTPLYGFSAITAPTLDAKTKTIAQSNCHHDVTVVTGGEEGPIVLTRGAQLGDAEFFRWVLAAITGDPSARPATSAFGVGAPIVHIRRNLFLIHFMGRIPFFASAGTDLTTGASRLGSAGGVTGAFLESLVPAPFEGGIKIPARCWHLKGCVPTKYKAASDFNATDSNISLMELTVQPEKIEEINLGV